MKRAILPFALVSILATAILLAQQNRPRPAGEHPQWEVKVLHPQEISAGRYMQVRPYELDNMAAEGWELVSMTEFVLRNEEHQGPNNERPMVTQAYLSYAFKRLKRTQ